MTQVLNKVREVDPNDSDAVKDVVNTFFQSLTKIDNSASIKWMRTLVDVINRFPKYCMSHRTTIENIIIQAIDSNNYCHVIEAAKCAQAVQQVRPSQEKTATPKTSWRDQMNILCNAAHSLITAIFPNSVDIYKVSKDAKSQSQESSSSLTRALLNIQTIDNTKNNDEKGTLLQTRLRNIFYFIQAMLVEIYPVGKLVRPQSILDVVVRALSVSSGTVDSGIDVATIKIEALRTLDALVVCLGPNLIPFSPLVFRLLMQTFRWTSENADKDFSNVRCSAYSSLGRWLNTLHSHRSAADSRTSWEDDLTNHIVKDIAPPVNIVELTMGPQPTKNMSKKAKRKLANAKLLESSIASHMPGEKNKISASNEVDNSVALAALGCAETFLIVCGRFLKPATHKIFQERTIRECYNAHKYPEDQLLLLLRVVEASRKTTPNNVPPPTQYCLQLYSMLINSGYSEISKFCTQALLDIRLHLHCSPPSVNFSLEATQEDQNTANKRKKISDKNMTSLKSLLGLDRVSSLTNEEEIVTIPDEPASKKPRLDETDKISVSSDSMQSVEISDDSDSDVQEVECNEEKEDNGKDSTDSNTQENSNQETVLVEDTNRNVELTSEESNSKQENGSDTVDTTTVGKAIEKKPSEVVSEDIEIVDDENVSKSVQETEINQAVQGKKNLSETKDTIHEVATQMPLNVSKDNEDEEGPLSLEISYDYPKAMNAKVNIITKEDEVISSSNEADDLIITCGQMVKSSQETELEKKSDDVNDSLELNIVTKVNGNNEVNGKSDCEIIHIDKDIITDVVKDGQNEVKNGAKDNSKGAEKENTKQGEISVEEMMADFVNEVNDDVTVV